MIRADWFQPLRLSPLPCRAAFHSPQGSAMQHDAARYIYIFIYLYIYLFICIIIYISADPGLRQGRGGACDHRRCGTCPVGPLHVRNWIKPFVAAQSKPFKPSNPSKPSKPLPLNSFPNRHPRARATAMTFYGLARKCSKPLQNAKHLPQQAPQGQGHSNGFL